MIEEEGYLTISMLEEEGYLPNIHA